MKMRIELLAISALVDLGFLLWRMTFRRLGDACFIAAGHVAYPKEPASDA